MATKMYQMGIFLVLALILCKEATAQSSSCSSSLMSLSPCLSYVTGNVSTPSASCCSSLGSVVASQPGCLCPLLNNGGSSLGIAINQTLAMALPNLCNVQTPPISQCNAVGNGPATAPAVSPSPVGSPTDDVPNEPAEPPFATTTDVPSVPSGSRTVPGTTGNTSDGSSITYSIQLMAFIIFVAAWTAKF